MSLQPTVMRIGFVPANRGTFSAELAAKMRSRRSRPWKRRASTWSFPRPTRPRSAASRTARRPRSAPSCSAAASVQGIVIGAVNFGDEQSAAWAVRQARLDVPVLIFGCQEEETLTRRRRGATSFCGLLSIGEVLRQIGVRVHRWPSGRSASPPMPSFAADLDWFVPRLPRGERACATPATARSAPGPTPSGPAASTRNSCSGWGRPRWCSTCPRRSPGPTPSATPIPRWPQIVAGDPALRRHVGRAAGQPGAQRQAGAVPAPLARGERRWTPWPSSAGPRSRTTTACAVARP